jgi:hypothetical protein
MALVGVAVGASLAGAQDLSRSQVAHVSISGMEVRFQPRVSAPAWALRVTGPAGFVAESRSDGGSVPSFSVFNRSGNPLVDGTYSYELRAEFQLNPSDLEAIEGEGADGRGFEVRGRRYLGLPTVSGTFTIAGGSIVTPGGGEPQQRQLNPGRAPGATGTPNQGITYAEDLIVQGSACVGVDCATGESFGFDTIRIKENNTRLKFDDTSSSAGFAANDWQLTANDSASGGANKFSIEDVTGAKVPFTIEAAAPTNSLYVDSTGRVGFRTATPVLDLHAATGNTPGLRLEQDGSSGFSPQTWDVAANEANFFVRDVTGGSRLPFRIRPGAPTSSIDVANNGNVGLGTGSPTEALHIARDAGVNGEIKFRIDNTAAGGPFAWAFSVVNSDPAHPQSFRISKQGTGGAEVEISRRLDGDGVPTLDVQGSVRATNVVFSSSRELKTEIAPLDDRDLLERVAALPMSQWRYKHEQDEAVRHVGPMAEDFKAAFDLAGDGKTISVVDANGVALASIKALYRQLEQREGEIRALQRANEDLAARLAELEGRLEQERER